MNSNSSTITATEPAEPTEQEKGAVAEQLRIEMIKVAPDAEALRKLAYGLPREDRYVTLAIVDRYEALARIEKQSEPAG